MHTVDDISAADNVAIGVVKLSVNMTVLAGRITLIPPKSMHRKSNGYNASHELEVVKQYAREMRKA
jgi:hypothetical protein